MFYDLEAIESSSYVTRPKKGGEGIGIWELCSYGQCIVACDLTVYAVMASVYVI